MNKPHKILLLNIEQGKLGKQCCCLVYRIVVSIGFVFLLLLLKNFMWVFLLGKKVSDNQSTLKEPRKNARDSPIHVYFDYIYAVIFLGFHIITHTDIG